jgi:hypothetical protein
MILMDRTEDSRPDEEIFSSVFDKNSWPYAGVDEELHLQNFEGKPYGPFNDWLLQLNLNINNGADYEMGHILLCMLNYAATHENKIEDTRDFLGFIWWYNEKIKKLRRIDDTEKRRSAYQELVNRIVDKTNYLSIDLFSPEGEIYAVSLLGKNAGISDYMSVKLKLQRHYIGIGEARDRDFVQYLDLREIDQPFFESLIDLEIYHMYFREFFLYELTPENIQDLLAEPKFALIKIPTKQTVLLAPEYLSQLTRIAFLMLSHVFLNQDGSARNADLLRRLTGKVNAKIEKKHTVNAVLELLKDRETLETDREFWNLFLETVTTGTAEEMEGAGSLQMYAFLLGAVMPEETTGAGEKAISKLVKARVESGDIIAFYDRISEEKTADYTFASLLDVLPGLPFTSKYRGMEKEFIEQSLEVLIRDRRVTKIREPNPKNISHFIVSKNILTVFYAFIEKIRDALTPRFRDKLPVNENEFRLELEKAVSAEYPVFYQMYVHKEFAGFVFQLLEKMEADTSAKYRSRLFIAAAPEPAFLPMSELLGISYALLKTRSIIEVKEKEAHPAETKPQEKKTPPDQAAKGIVPPEEDKKENREKTGFPVEPKAEKHLPRPVRDRNETQPADFIEVLVLIFRSIGKAFQKMMGGIKTVMARSIEKDIERKKSIRNDMERKQKENKVTEKAREMDVERETAVKERDAGKKEVEISLQAIAKTLVEEFTGSRELGLGEAVHTLAELWNDPKTIKPDEKDFIKKDNIARINTIINNNCKNLYSKGINQAKIMERAAEIADFYGIGDILKNLVTRKENKEIIRRYVALCLCMILLKK